MCAQVFRAPATELVENGVVWAFRVLLGALCIWRGASPASLPPSCVQSSDYAGVPIAGHAHWAEVGGGIIFVTHREFTGLHKSSHIIFWKMEVISSKMPHMLVLAGQPTLCGYCACKFF